MKKSLRYVNKVVAGTLLLFVVQLASGQNNKDTIKTSKPNDAMTVNPGKTNDANAMMTDTGFISKNIADNLLEIQLANAGLKSGSAAVKKIALVIITDHTEMLTELKRLALVKHISIPEDKSAMSGKTEIPTSSNNNKAGFNAAWASEMLTMHEAKMKELENFISVTQDAQIKAVAGKALPKIRMHRDMLLKIPGAKAAATNTI